jgi:hypothetical protein
VPIERVGDAVASRTMMDAVHEGERAARRIPGGPADIETAAAAPAFAGR